MPDEKNTDLEPENTEKKEETVYATPMKRLWAWVGIAYMVILVLLMTYSLANGGLMNGIGPLMLSPALAGIGASAILRYRTGWGRGGLPVCIFISSVAFALTLLNIARCIPTIITQVRGIGG